MSAIRRTTFCVAAWMALLAACADGESGGFSRSTSGRPRTLRPTAAPASDAAPVAASTPTEAGPADDSRTASLFGEDLHRLDLVSPTLKPGVAVSQKATRLRHAAARPCGRLLAMLYIPVSAVGSQDEYSLIYDDRAAFEAARDCLDWLDVPTPPVDSQYPQIMFQKGVALLRQLCLQVTSPDAQAVRDCQAAFERAAAAADQTTMRWAAAMFAGHVAQDLRFDAADARKHFEQAKKLAAPRSLEQLMAAWSIAQTCENDADPVKFRSLCAAIVRDFDHMQRSHVCQRAKRGAAKP